MITESSVPSKAGSRISGRTFMVQPKWIQSEWKVHIMRFILCSPKCGADNDIITSESVQNVWKSQTGIHLWKSYEKILRSHKASPLSAPIKLIALCQPPEYDGIKWYPLESINTVLNKKKFIQISTHSLSSELTFNLNVALRIALVQSQYFYTEEIKSQKSSKDFSINSPNWTRTFERTW